MVGLIMHSLAALYHMTCTGQSRKDVTGVYTVAAKDVRQENACWTLAGHTRQPQKRRIDADLLHIL